MLSDKDITTLRTIFATKDDLARFATRDDLKRFATKKDLEPYATKDDLEKLRKEIDQRLSQFAADIIHVLDEQARSYRDEILSKIDGYMKTTEDLKQEHVLLVNQVDRHDKWIHVVAEKTETELSYD
jgi:t-SNARE complex subunit (syntaxin)